MSNKFKLMALMALMLSLIAFMSGNLNARELKIAVVDIKAIKAQLPQMREIQIKVAKEFEEQMSMMRKLQSDAKYNYDKLQREGATLNKKQQDELKKTILSQQRELEERGAPLRKTMTSRGAELQNELMAAVLAKVEVVATKGGYDFTFHKNTIAFTPHSHVDITKEVLEALKATL